MSSSQQEPTTGDHPLEQRRSKVRHLKDLVDSSEYQVPADKVADEIIRGALVLLPPTSRRH